MSAGADSSKAFSGASEHQGDTLHVGLQVKAPSPSHSQEKQIAHKYLLTFHGSSLIITMLS